MKLWHNDWDKFKFADEQPKGFTSAENETGVDIFCYVFDTKAAAKAEADLVNESYIDDVNSEVYKRGDGKYFVITIDWCGGAGLMMQQLCDQEDINRGR